MRGNVLKAALSACAGLGAAGFAPAIGLGQNLSLTATGTWSYDWTNPLGGFSFASNNPSFLNTSNPFLGRTWSNADLTAEFTPDGSGGFAVSFALTADEGDPTLSELDGTFTVTPDSYTYRADLNGTTPEPGDFFVWTASPVDVTNATNGFAGLSGVDAFGSGIYVPGGTSGFIGMDYKAVPEPFAMGLAALGIGLAGVVRRRATGNVACISKNRAPKRGKTA